MLGQHSLSIRPCTPFELWRPGHGPDSSQCAERKPGSEAEADRLPRPGTERAIRGGARNRARAVSSDAAGQRRTCLRTAHAPGEEIPSLPTYPPPERLTDRRKAPHRRIALPMSLRHRVVMGIGGSTPRGELDDSAALQQAIRRGGSIAVRDRRPWSMRCSQAFTMDAQGVCLRSIIARPAPHPVPPPAAPPPQPPPPPPPRTGGATSRHRGHRRPAATHGCRARRPRPRATR